MDKNIQEMLGGILSSLPAESKKEVQNCESKDQFLDVLGAAKGLDIGGLLGGLLGGDKADSNPLGGLLGGLLGGDKSSGSNDLVSQLSGLLKGIDWSEIQKFITAFFNKK